MKKIAISEFKAHCLEVIDKMQTDGNPILITKRGEVVAKVIPFQTKVSIEEEIRRKFEGKAEIIGDIVNFSPWGEDWEEKWLAKWDKENE